MDEKIVKEYKSSFKFGSKFLILLSLFLLPPVIGFSLGALFSSILQKFPATYKSELTIERIQSYPYSSTQETRGKIESSYTDKSGQKVFVLLTREPIDKFEQGRIIDTLNSIVDDSSTKKISGKDIFDEISPDKDTQNYFHYKFSSWNKTALYGSSTTLGTWLNGIFFFILTIICIALYFPLVKAMINLFKRKPLL